MTLTPEEALLRSSPKFQAWGKLTIADLEESNIMAEERHYTPAELAEIWGVDVETIRNLFREEPGVLKIGRPGGKRRGYITLRIPESVAERLHTRLSA